MYEQIKKPKESKNKVITNNVRQKNSNTSECLGFIDNRSKMIIHNHMHRLISDKQANKNSSNVLQRVKYSVDEIVNTLGSIEFGGIDFNNKIKLDSEIKSEQGITLKDIVRARLTRLSEKQKKFKDDEYTALQISYVTDTIGEYIAKSKHVNMPRMKDKISSLLIKYFSSKITQNLMNINKELNKDSISLSQYLSSTDPIALYIKKMIPLKKAIELIKQVAGKTNKKPIDILKMYIQRFKDRILGFSKDQISTGEKSKMYDGKKDFPIKDLVGNLSTNFYKYVSGESKTYSISENYKWSNDINKRYKELENVINNTNTDIEIEESSQEPPHIKVLKTILENKEKENAKKYWKTMENEINKMPILIIINAKRMKEKEKMSKKKYYEHKSMIEFIRKNKSILDLIIPNMNIVSMKVI